ncbi:MAG TPA: ribosome-associated translation inhibitor RaiA [Tenericutes bacterium]|nr:ribosome-associated translation inhibitor RaiA [Mycoplasmatota bacterium]
MIYKIHGENIEVTDAIKEHIENKLSKINKYLSNPDKVTAKVVLSVYDASQKVEITIPLEQFTLRIEEEHGDLYTAVDHAADKLERQLRKQKTKLKAKMKKGKEEIKFDFDDNGETEEELIVRYKKVELKPMDAEEAILQMELLDHDFFIYLDMEKDAVCVVYKRKKGGYGIIETM